MQRQSREETATISGNRDHLLHALFKLELEALMPQVCPLAMFNRAASASEHNSEELGVHVSYVQINALFVLSYSKSCM